MMAQPPANPFHFASSLFTPAHTTYSPARKRRAPTPPLDTPQPSQWCYGDLATDPNSPSAKRRRPNLAYGFSGLSISPQLATAAPTNEEADDISPDAPNAPVTYDDVEVQVLPDHVSQKRHNHHHHSTLHHWSVPNHASSSSSSPLSEHSDYSSDEAFRPELYTRPQQADEVLSPDSAKTKYLPDHSVEVEDVTSSTRGHKRREKMQDGLRRTKRRKDEMDMDMDMDADVNHGDRRMRRKTVWHEPEKDRIVITSLSESGSSRSSSPDLGFDDDDRRLTQPGDNGFTISPSLLTHLLKARRHDLDGYDNIKATEKGLILYRPLGLQPGQVEDIVKQWTGEEPYEDSGRFEEIDDDESTGMDAVYDSGHSGGPWADEDVEMSMDVE